MRRRKFLRTTCTAATGLLILGERARAASLNEADQLLHGALVYDGTGAPPVEVDVLVAGGRIARVGRGLRTAGAAVVDLRGLALAPGFIDVHAHSDFELLINPRAESKIRQGVTTEVIGQDGSSIGLWSDERYAGIRERYREAYGIEIDFRDVGGFLRRMDRDGAAVNLASMIGTGTVRGAVIGYEDRPATEEELARMVALVEAAVREGACGLSSGLEYTPGAFANKKELYALAAPLRGLGLPYASHMRNEDDEVFAAIEEALAVGRGAGVPVQISHLKTMGRRNWWKTEPALRMLEAAREAGIDVTYDRYPYLAYSTGLSSLFPVWAREGGSDAFRARLADPSVAPGIEAAVRDKIELLGDWDSVQITSTDSESYAWARGERLGELAAERGRKPYELAVELVIDGAGMVGFAMSEENTDRILAHPLGMVCSDGSALATYGPLSDGSPHPRSYGTFPRVLGYYCRERGIMPLETAIHKMSGMPARKLRLADRGRVAAGMAADLVAFDPDRVTDRATYEHPHRYPDGIPHVWVNGRRVIRDGEHTGALPGRALRPGPSV